MWLDHDASHIRLFVSQSWKNVHIFKLFQSGTVRSSYSFSNSSVFSFETYWSQFSGLYNPSFAGNVGGIGCANICNLLLWVGKLNTSFSNFVGIYINYLSSTLISMVCLTLFRENESDRYAINDFDRLFENPNFNTSKTTAFYAHGCRGNQMNPRSQTIFQAYRKRRHSHNMLSLDWAGPSLGNGNYRISVYNSVMVSIPFCGFIFSDFRQLGS